MPLEQIHAVLRAPDLPTRDRQDTADEKEWRTEVCWPIFTTGTAS
jgi:hypothetical protein